LLRQILIPALHVASFDAGHVTAQPRQLSCTGMLQALSEYDAAVPWSDAASEYDPAVPGSDAAKLPNKTSPMTIAEYDTVRISPPKEMLHRKASTRATPTSENAGRPSFRDVTARDHEGWQGDEHEIRNDHLCDIGWDNSYVVSIAWSAEDSQGVSGRVARQQG
jgi:hypothetical protein